MRSGLGVSATHALTWPLLPAAGLAFLGDGKHLVSAGNESALCIWVVSPESPEKFVLQRYVRLQTAYVGGAPPAPQVPLKVRRAPPSLSHTLPPAPPAQTPPAPSSL